VRPGQAEVALGVAKDIQTVVEAVGRGGDVQCVRQQLLVRVVQRLQMRQVVSQRHRRGIVVAGVVDNFQVHAHTR
jgi:hypothetical protein